VTIARGFYRGLLIFFQKIIRLFQHPPSIVFPFAIPAFLNFIFANRLIIRLNHRFGPALGVA
jgi:hypothetical protein